MLISDYQNLMDFQLGHYFWHFLTCEHLNKGTFKKKKNNSFLHVK